MLRKKMARSASKINSFELSHFLKHIDYELFSLVIAD